MDALFLHVVSEIGCPLYSGRLTHTRKLLTYAPLLVKIDVEGEKASMESITLPTGAQLDLQIKTEVMMRYCE